MSEQNTSLQLSALFLAGLQYISQLPSIIIKRNNGRLKKKNIILLLYLTSARCWVIFYFIYILVYVCLSVCLALSLIINIIVLKWPCFYKSSVAIVS